MTVAFPHTAFVLAAGLGTRMRPLTDECPKPLLKVGGKAMLDSVLDRLMDAGVKKAVVNAFYKREKIHEHLKHAQGNMQIIVSDEDALLDTGGGVKKALPHLGQDPIFVINADLPWTDGPHMPALQRMATQFDKEKMDALLLLMPLEKARGFSGAKGDFFMDDGGRLSRLHAPPPRPYVFISAQIVNPLLYNQVHEDIFSNNVIWDRAEKAGRLFGMIYDGTCFHVGTPPDLAEANRLLDEGKGW